MAITGSVPRPAVAALLLLAALRCSCAERRSGGADVAGAPSPSVDLPDGGGAAGAPGRVHRRLRGPVERSCSRLPHRQRLRRRPGDHRGAGRPAIYPGPALPNVQVQQTRRRPRCRRWSTAALAAGVAETADLGSPPIADVPSTRFTLTTAERHRRARGRTRWSRRRRGRRRGAASPEEQATAARELRDLLAALLDVGQQPTPDGPPPVEPYVPTAVAAIATPWIDPEDELGPPGAAVARPGAARRAAGRSARRRLRRRPPGTQATAVLGRGCAANAATPWVPGGTRWSVAFRPLLPDESGCADLLD